MVRQDVFPPQLLLLLLLLLSAESRQQDRRRSLLLPEEEQRCPCRRWRMKARGDAPFPNDFIQGNRSGKLNCCRARFLGNEDPKATVQWEFRGEAYPWPPGVSTFKKHYCGMETLETRGASLNDEGSYACTVTSSNGTVVKRTMNLTVSPITDFRTKPSALVMSDEVYASEGRSASFTCRAYVGRVSAIAPRVSWTKFCPDGRSCYFAKELPSTNTSSVIRRGEITGRLVISRVEKAHFGTYSCRVRNTYGTTRGNFSLIEGVPELERTKENYKITVVAVVVMLFLALLAFYILRRYGLPLRLYCSHSIVSSSAKEGFQQDVFLVHGDSASCWVWTVLLPMLEDTCGYTCFLPQRDMCGGDQVAESVLGAISKCRRVLVVATPCLLESPWASWAMCSGIHAVLTSRTRMLALVLKRETMLARTPRGETLLGILKVVRQVAVPAAASGAQKQLGGDVGGILESSSGAGERARRHPRQEDSPTKLTIPEIRVDSSSWSSSPKSQRLSNMISGSNAASRERLPLEQDKRKAAETAGGGAEGGGGGGRSSPVVFTEEFGLQDPGSPCSITPFILPSSYAKGNASVWVSLRRCLHAVFFRDEEQVFWQTVRYRLGPPSRRIRP